jgi:uncharacterized protein (DUF1501 family)
MKTHDWTFCDGTGGLEKSRPTRRSLLAASTLAGLAWASSALAQTSFSATAEDRDVLVVIFLRGGMDGLNLLAPYRDDIYQKARPTIALQKSDVRDIDGYFGLNPAMAPLYDTWESGELALIHACGSGDTTRSHFEAMNLMETGRQNESSHETSGWIGRYLNANPGGSTPLRAVALSDIMPDSLLGATNALALSSLEKFKLDVPEDLRRKLEALYGGKPRDYMHRAGQDTLKVLKLLEKLDPTGYTGKNLASYPESDLGQGLRQVAMLIKSGVGLEVACLDKGGWDTHVAQGRTSGWFTSYVDDLALSLQAFLKDMGPAKKRVTVLVQTEFGRRLNENAGLGTDHGRGSVAMVLGGAVNGGLKGEWPGLKPDQLDSVGDLRAVNDYRNVLAEVLQKRMACRETESIFPKLDFKPFGVF